MGFVNWSRIYKDYNNLPYYTWTSLEISCSLQGIGKTETEIALGRSKIKSIIRTTFIKLTACKQTIQAIGNKNFCISWLTIFRIDCSLQNMNSLRKVLYIWSISSIEQREITCFSNTLWLYTGYGTHFHSSPYEKRCTNIKDVLTNTINGRVTVSRRSIGMFRLWAFMSSVFNVKEALLNIFLEMTPRVIVTGQRPKWGHYQHLALLNVKSDLLCCIPFSWTG